MDTETAAAWQSAANSVSNNASIIAQANLNYKTRQWNEKMYGQQRTDALADRDYANAYNSPSATMARLKEGGLNPNLVYGNGATTEASPVRSSSPGSWTPKAPEYENMGKGLESFYNYKMMNAQINQVEMATKVAEQDRILKAAQTVGTMTNNDVAGFGLMRNRDNLDLYRQQLEANLGNTISGASLKGAQGDKVNQDRISSIMTRDADLKIKEQQLINMATANSKDQSQTDLIKQNLKNAGLYQKLQQLQIDMRKQGVNDTDNPALRIFTKWFNDYLGSDAPKSGAGKMFEDTNTKY